MRFVILSLTLAAILTAQGASAAPPREDQGQDVEIRGGWASPPLRPLPFALRLGPDRPDSLRDAVSKIYDALPRRHLERIAALYGFGRRTSERPRLRTAEDQVQQAYTREILDAAFRSWGYGEGNGNLGPEISCVGPIPEHITLQLAMMYIYGRPPGIRFRSQLTRVHAQSEMISRRLFEICERATRSGVLPPH